MLLSVGIGPAGSRKDVMPGTEVRTGMEVAVMVEVSGALAKDSDDVGMEEERAPAAEVVTDSGVVVAGSMEAEVVPAVCEVVIASALDNTAVDEATASTPDIALLDTTTALLEATTDDEVPTAEEATGKLEVPSAAAQAKLIFCVKVPVLFGALKSQVIATYGQQIFPPTTAISPLTKTSVFTTSLPLFVPELSTNWKLVPA